MKKLSLTSNAASNHQELFPDHESRLQETDPEFIELFDNFAFGEVISHSRLDARTRMLMILGSTIAAKGLGEFRIMLGAALNVGLTPVETKEVLYHAVPYVGVAQVIDFLDATNEVLQARGISLPLAGQSTTTTKTRFDKGVAAQKAIFGDAIEKMRKSAPSDEGHIQDFLSANCFGDYYTRAGLDIQTRELLTFALLVSLGGCQPQVKSHVVGNVKMGNDRECLIDVVTQLLPYIGYPRSLNALQAIDEAAPLVEAAADCDPRTDH